MRDVRKGIVARAHGFDMGYMERGGYARVTLSH